MNPSVRDFDADPAGRRLSTEAIQRAIDRCAEAGGGFVRFPAGRYLSASLQLRDGVHLQLDAGATLLASTDPEDYGGQRGKKGSAKFLEARDVENIGLVGPGDIDGQATANFNGYDPRRGRLDPVPLFRIGLIRFDRCRDVRVRDITLRHSDAWTLHLRRCNRVWIDNIAIRNNVNRLNSDGIDPDSSRNVHISNCHIVAGDDCLVFKTTTPDPCEDIVVTNCTMETTCTGLKFGTESKGHIRNVLVRNCVMRNTSSGIAFHMKDGATMETITLAGITYEEREDDPVRYVASPLLMDIERRHADTPPGVIRDITIADFSVRSRLGMLIQGMPESPIRNLRLRNLQLRIDAPWDFGDRHKRIAGLRTTQDERDTLFARKPAYLTVAHVEHGRIENVDVDIAPEIFDMQPRTALWLEKVHSVTHTNIARHPEADMPPVVVHKE